MKGATHISGMTAVAVAAMLCVTPGASAFELFGVHLWGESETDAASIEIINPLNYSVQLRMTGGSDEVRKTVEAASALLRDQEGPVSGNSGMIAKAKGDYRRILGSLFNEGYFGPGISIKIDGEEVAEMTLAAELQSTVPVVITVDPGPRFKFGRAEIVNPPIRTPEIDGDRTSIESTDFKTGRAALAKRISAATSLATLQWRYLSHAKVNVTGREIVADHDTNRLDVTVNLDPGPKVTYGNVTAEGSESVDLDFIAWMAGLTDGDSYNPEDIIRAEDRLSFLGVFDSIRLEEGAPAGPNGRMPVVVSVEDRKPRTVGFGGTYSTLDGLGLSAYWLHRNILGKAERLRFDASIERLLTTSDWRDYNYNAGVTFTKPGVFLPDTSFVSSLIARQLDFETYRETSLTARAGFSHRFDERTNIDLLGEVSRARYEDDFGTRDFTTFALIGRGEFDRRNDPLDATHGYYLAAELVPFYEAEYGNTSLRGTLEGRVFHAFDNQNKYVLAGRAKLGSFIGAPTSEAPPNQLFFAGGGGSVRGYEYQSIGVQVPCEDDDEEFCVVGGRSLLELGGEVRVRLTETFGAVGFVDAGLVTADSDWGTSDDLRTSVGLGVRYYTGLGPLRLDVAVPLDRRPVDEFAALYIGIGQAF